MKGKSQIIVVDRLDEIFDVLNAAFQKNDILAGCQQASAKILKLRLEIEHGVNEAGCCLDVVLKRGENNED